MIGRFDVLGVGNAIVDVLMPCEESFLADHGLHKGAMKLLELDDVEALHRQMINAQECSGGSAGNSLAGLAMLGGKGAFVGRVHDDAMGKLFRKDLESIGVHYSTPPTIVGVPTARCLVLVTPDGQRTMCTYLGACTKIAPDDVPAELIKMATILFFEGYLWDEPNAKAAVRKAIQVAKKQQRQISLALLDTEVVNKRRDEFLLLVKEDIDILFANEPEIKALYQTTDLALAIARAQRDCRMVVITREEKGCVVIAGAEIFSVPAEKVNKVVDTTGAGDLFVSGFLYGYTKGWDLRKCAQLGNKCGAHIIQQLGGRSSTPLKGLIS